jgi:hypothetical protein
VRDYLSCNIILDKDNKKEWLGQPHLTKNLENKFGQLVAKSMAY